MMTARDVGGEVVYRYEELAVLREFGKIFGADFC